MERYWIIGFGKVGRRALERLRRKSPDAAITVVDPKVSIPEGEENHAHWVAVEGVSFLLDRPLDVRSGHSPWIVPALPHHLAYAWMMAQMKPHGMTVVPYAVPETVVGQLPNPLRGSEGQVYISLADFLCPDNCNEPEKKCPGTGRARPYRLFEHLAGLSTGGARSLVIRSHQLAPGVGGYRGTQLTAALDDIDMRPGRYLVSTASKCHAVMHAFELKRK
jgi:hypothetical protein